MQQIIPHEDLVGVPCSVVAVSCALGWTPAKGPVLYESGYATLAEANKYIRANLPVKKRIDYKRGERPALKDLHLTGKAVVCVYGHFIFVDGEKYWSFFHNENDAVVAVWLLAE